MTRARQQWVLASTLLLALLWPTAALAHGGPPYIVLGQQMIGPFTATVWADPDVGTGLFIIDTQQHDTAPAEDLRVDMTIHPTDGHAPAASYTAERQATSDPAARFVAQVPFDAAGPWDVQLLLDGPAGHGMATFTIEVTPPGPWWSSMLCLVPFMGIGGLWLLGIRRERRITLSQS